MRQDTTSATAVTVYGQLSLFEIPLLIRGQFLTSGEDRTVRFTVQVGDKTLGEVIRYILGLVGGPPLRLDPPWDAVERINLSAFVFLVETTNGVSRYGISYGDLGLDLGFLKLDKVEVHYIPANDGTPEKINASLDVNVFGSFLGVGFHDEPVGWDALREQPPQTPAGSDKMFRLDYLGLGQNVTLRNIEQLTSVAAVIDALRDSYAPLAGDPVEPLDALPALTFDNGANWLIGTSFTVMETFDFAGVWNLPALAGARISLKGERARSLAGLEFEILYRRIADDLGQYHVELVLPDVLRRFQAGIASVTLPVIAIDIYTDGAFLIDLGFPRGLDFTRSFAIEMLIMGIPVTGAIGIYFGVLGPQAVPDLPVIRGGEFRPVIVVGVGFRLGLGKSLRIGILDAGFFLGIEGLLEGTLGFYESYDVGDAKATFYRVQGRLQLTVHVFGKVNFAIISAEVDIYVYIAVEATFEACRASLVAFEAGIDVRLVVKVNLGLFKVSIRLSFSAMIREEIVIGHDSVTPWQLDEGTPPRLLADRIGPVSYRRLPTGDIIADEGFAALLAPGFRADRLALDAWLAVPSEPAALEVFFSPVISVGTKGCDASAPPSDETVGEVKLVASLMIRLARIDGEPLAPAEVFVWRVLGWGLDQVVALRGYVGAADAAETVTLSQLKYIADHLDAENAPIKVTPQDVRDFFAQHVTPVLKPAIWSDAPPALTPFPMIPVLTLTAGRGDTVSHRVDFETDPLCSVAYQKNIHAYFEALNPMRDAPGANGRGGRKPQAIDGDLSMVELIFIDSFKLVLRNVIAKSIAVFEGHSEDAGGRTLRQVAQDCGLDSPGGMARILAANGDSREVLPPESALMLARDGVLLSGISGLRSLARHWNLTALGCARAIRTQPVLRAGASIVITGGQHLLTPTDTIDSLLQRYGITRRELDNANPFFDWSVTVENAQAPWPPEYPRLKVPAGCRINLPPLAVTLTETDTLDALCRRFGGMALWQIVEANPDLPLGDAGLAWQGIGVYVQQGETIAAITDRVAAGAAPEFVAQVLLDDPRVLPEDARLAVAGGSYVIARGDTLEGICAAFQISETQLREANPEAPWKFLHRPGVDEAMPEGVTLVLPAVEAFRPSGMTSDTVDAISSANRPASLSDVARLFGIDAIDLALQNAERLVLATMAQIVLPPVPATVAASGQSPTELGLPFAVPPEAILRANQGAGAGQGAGQQLGRVRIPDCEILTRDRLKNALARDGGEASDLVGVASAMARFLMAGLRLPAPGGMAETMVPGAEEPLYPLYSLTGQQWPAPADASTEDWVQLSINESPAAKALFPRDVASAPVRVKLTDNDVAVIAAFAAEAAAPEGLQPTIVALTGYPALEQLRLELKLGSAAEWSLPAPFSFLPDAAGGSGDADQVALLHDLPRGMRERLPMAQDLPLVLDVFEVSADPVARVDTRRRLSDIGWATRLDLQLRKAPSRGNDATTTYEVISLSSQSQADLEGLRLHVKRANAILAVDLYLLYAAGPLSSVSQTLRTDSLDTEALSRVVLLKSNLSTFSNPVGPLLRDPRVDLVSVEQRAAAALSDGEAFLDLLWQVSVTSGGGFFLDYPIGREAPGLPDALFGEDGVAKVSVLAVVRGQAGPGPTIPPARFHNVLITAGNLSQPDAQLTVMARDHVVGLVDSVEPAISESLDMVARATNVSASLLAVINASTPALLVPGQRIRYDRDGSYTVNPGDDLQTVALQIGQSLEQLGSTIGPLGGLLKPGRAMSVQPGWVASRSRISPSQAGFRLLRTPPVEPPQPTPAAPLDTVYGNNAGVAPSQRDGAIDPAEARYRIQTLFQLLAYALVGDRVFRASPEGLPLIPDGSADPHNPLSQIALADDGDATPWNYRRLLPITPFARPSEFEPLPVPDPYAGLGETATIRMEFQDVFGNRLPRSGEPLSQTWLQCFRDPVLPLHAWPSVALSFDVETRPTWHAPRLRTTVNFAPAGYTPRIGQLHEAFRNRSHGDLEKLALAFYQVVQQRMQARIEVSLLPGAKKPVSTARLAVFARDAWHFVETMRALTPLRHIVTEADTFATLAKTYGVAPLMMARHLGVQAGLLSGDVAIRVPQMVTALPNQSLTMLASDNAQGRLTPADIGKLNADTPLTVGLLLRRRRKLVEVGPGDTLRKLHDNTISVAQLAKVNANVAGIFASGSSISLGVSEVVADQGQSLAQIALEQKVDFDLLARTNLTRNILQPGSEAEVPLHMRVTDAPKSSARIAKGMALENFAETHDASVRDIATANGALIGILQPGAKLAYGLKGKVWTETVGPNDTLAAIATRFAAVFGDPSITPADIGNYPANARDTALFADDALLILPPLRFFIDVDVPESATRSITIVDLRCWLTLQRETMMIDPAFRQVAEALEASSPVAPRLSSDFTRDERGTLRAFARRFQDVFPNLRLAVGADRIRSTDPARPGLGEEHEPSKLVVVQWDPQNFWAGVEGTPRFYAPRPLLNMPWAERAVPIHPYVPGQPLYPAEGSGASLPTDFSGVDLERWAERLLARIDRVLQPDMAVPINRDDPQTFQKIVNAKRDIAQAVADRTTDILVGQTGGDAVAAGEQLRQQLLTELATAYRGGVVVQYDVDARVRQPRLPFDLAPRLLAAIAPALRQVPGENPTLDTIAAMLGADSEVTADLIQNVQDLLCTGASLPLDPPPDVSDNTIRETDTLARIAARYGITLDQLTAAIHDVTGLFRAGAQLPVAHRQATTGLDDTFGSVIEKLAPNLTTQRLVDRAIHIFASLNETQAAIFVDKAEIRWNGKVYHTRQDESLQQFAQRLGATDQIGTLIDELWATAPLLREGATFDYLAQYPPITASATKIVVGAPTVGRNSMNTVVVTTAPDEASSISLALSFSVQAMEYNIHAVEDGAGYLASDWLHFVDWRHEQKLGKVAIPIPNRQFPLPPVVLRHEAEPKVKDGEVDPSRIGEVMAYDYVLDFSFHAATQDHIYYTAEFNVAAADTADAQQGQLARDLAQFDAVDAALWGDVLGLLSDEADPVITRAAVASFGEIAHRAAGSWPLWQPSTVTVGEDDSYRIRRHRHPVSGRSTLTIAPTAGARPVRSRSASEVPQVRQLGVASRQGQLGRLSHSVASDAAQPVPTTRRGAFYEVRDPGQTILRQQNCWGRIGVKRNQSLIDGVPTASDFVLHLPEVRALQPLTPGFRITQVLRAGTAIAPLEERLAEVLETLFFPDQALGQARISVTVAYARPLFEDGSHGVAGRAESRMIFVPVITSPVITLMAPGGEAQPDPKATAKAISDRLGAYLAEHGLAPAHEWSLTIKLFSGLGEPSKASVLLEVVDLRLRMSDQ